MSLSVRAFFSACCASIGLFLATGCGISATPNSSASVTSLALIHGKMHGGQQPVSGGSIQLYAASATANQGASTALLASPVTSDSGGNFSITGLYTCPSSDALVYLVGTGGNPGLPGTVNNPGIAMMSLLGTCSSVAANAATMFVDVDELTTVVAVQALAPFMTDYAHVGSAPTSVNGVGGAFDTATSEIDFATGQFQGGPNLDLTETTLDTLANIIAACINTAGGTGPCATLYANTGGTSNTISAALQMVKAPGQNTATLYNLITANPPFQPYFTSVPSDFTTSVGYTIPAFVQGGTVDSNGHIWLYYGGYNYDTASDTSTDSAGYIVVYDNNFNQLFTVNPGTGGLYYPDSFSPDASGHVFAINANNTISEFGSNGAALSPAAGWPSGSVSTFSPTGPGNNYIYNPNQSGPIAVDALGNIWGANPYASTNCYFELNSAGMNITPAGTFCTASGVSSFDTAVVDGMGSAWALGYSTIAKVNAAGMLAATAPTSQGCFYPQSSATTTTAREAVTVDLLYDRVNNRVWGVSQTGAGTISDAGAAVFCDYGAASLPVLPKYGSPTTTPGAAYSGGSLLIGNSALDGAGNLWFVTGGVSATGVVGSGAGKFTGTATYASYLGEISAAGALVTPYNASNQTYGLQPAGFGANVTAAANNVSVPASGPSVDLLGIDPFGNIWAVDAESYRIIKITGLAVANTVNYQ